MRRYKRILAVGDARIATLNPSTFEVTNQVFIGACSHAVVVLQ